MGRLELRHRLVALVVLLVEEVPRVHPIPEVLLGLMQVELGWEAQQEALNVRLPRQRGLPRQRVERVEGVLFYLLMPPVGEKHES